MHAKEVNRLVNIFRFTTWIKVIAITGGPCAGKSTFLKMAIQMLRHQGIIVVVVPEVARELISSGICPWDPTWKQGTDFQKHILFNILRKEASFFEALYDMNIEGKQVVFLCDRGIPDGQAYCGQNEFRALLASLGVTLHDVIERYDQVIHLVTAAMGAEEFYVTDEERHETIAQARELDLATRAAWNTHQHFMLVDNRGTFDEKVLRALLALKRIIPMENNALEIEKKFLVRLKPGCDLGEFPFMEIQQTYLVRKDKPGIECRVRKKTFQDTPSYTYTEKTKTEVEGVRGESEEKITEARFEELLKSYRDPGCSPIRKIRYKIPLEGEEILELDVYQGELAPFVVAEVEFKTVEDMAAFKFPTWLGDAQDVTSDSRYSNASLARFGFPI